MFFKILTFSPDPTECSQFSAEQIPEERAEIVAYVDPQPNALNFCGTNTRRVKLKNWNKVLFFLKMYSPGGLMNTFDYYCMQMYILSADLPMAKKI